MNIWVCAKNEISMYAYRYRPSHLLTILDVGDHQLTPYGLKRDNHKSLFFMDTEKKHKQDGPKFDHCLDIIDWTNKLPDESTVLVHCYAGMCRSTATAMAMYVAKNGNDKINAAAKWILDIRPIAMPNLLMAEYYDEILDADGKFYAACKAINKNAMGYLLRGLAEADDESEN